MKKLRCIILIVLAAMSISKVNSQIIIDYTFPDYDTVIIFQPQQFVGYPMVMDDLTLTWRDSSYWPLDFDNPCNCEDDYIYWTNEVTYYGQYNGYHTVALKNKFCKTGNDTIEVNNDDFHCTVSLSKFANGFAQPYHLEDSAIVGGVALYCAGHFDYEDALGAHNVYLFDTNFNQLASGPFYTLSFTEYPSGNSFTYNNGGLNKYYFQKKEEDEYPRVKDFCLGFDVGWMLRANHTCRIDDDCLKDSLISNGYCYDTIFYGRIPNDLFGCHPDYLMDTVDLEYTDTIPCCPYSGHPYFRDTNGVWKSFEEDSVFWIYRNIFIQALPIILVPHQEDTSSLAEINIDDYCYVYPNPTRTMIKAVSNFKIWTIEMIDMNGRKVYKKDLDGFMDEIDVTHFAKGTYVVNLFTSKGRCTKKILVQ